MKRIFFSLTFMFGLSTNFLYPMQGAAQKTNLHNSAKWINRHKTHLIVGAAGLVVAKNAYSQLTTPTPDEVKVIIKRDSQAWIQDTVFYLDDCLLTRSIHRNLDPYYGYEITIEPFTTETRLGIKAHYKFACDNSTETETHYHPKIKKP